MSNEDHPKAALVLAGGGITGGVYELGVLSALDDFIVKGGRSGEFDHYVGISAGSMVAAFLANGISVDELSGAILGTGDEGLLLRREDIYSFRFSPFLRAAWAFLRHTPAIVRHLRSTGQRVTFLNTIAYLQQFLPPGIFSNANLERYMRRALSSKGRSNDFRELRRDLSIVAVEADLAERWIFGAGGVQDVSISKAIQASSAIPVFFEPVRIGEHLFIDGAAERVGHLDIALGAGARLVLLVNPTVPIYNDRSVVCLPTLSGRCSSVTELGFMAISEQVFRINSRVKLELGVTLFRQRYPDVDLLVIEPSPEESTLFLSGSMNFDERVQSLNFGYNSAARYFTEQYGMLKDCFARNGREVSLDGLKSDRFLALAGSTPKNRRFRMRMHGEVSA
jgi:predicted acylesterase/phospholipase RssA